MAVNKFARSYSDRPGKLSEENKLSDPIHINTLLDEIKLKNMPNYDKPVLITNPSNIHLILKSFGDADVRKIFETTSHTPKSVMEILSSCNVPHTSAYRKILELIQKGLLISSGYVIKHGRKVIKYKPIFEDVKIHIINNQIIILVKLGVTI